MMQYLNDIKDRYPLLRQLCALYSLEVLFESSRNISGRFDPYELQNVILQIAKQLSPVPHAS